MSRQVVVTAFEPFGGLARNPSAEALAMLADRVNLITELLPVEYTVAGARVERLLADLRPAAWVGLGLDAGATAIKLERRAINLDDASVPDNRGILRQGVPVDPTGPAEWTSTLPLNRLAAAVPGTGLSDSAGRFVCNHTFYRAMVAAERWGVPMAGFVHVPWPADWPGAGRALDHDMTFAAIVNVVDRVLELIRPLIASGHRG